MTLRVPRTDPFPSLANWRQANCGALRANDSFEVTAEQWRPALGDDESRAEADQQLQQVGLFGRATARRSLASEAADPFWTVLLKFSKYQSFAQKQSARVVASASPGQSVLVVLPTGHGKTAIAWIRMLQSPRTVTVVVVPTVILALDMERRTRDFFRDRQDGSPSGRYAYTGSLDAGSKEALRQDIREGTQRIVYASPEAVVTGLSASLIAAADNGVLGTLVVDEAHLVEDWGSEFRPEFQSLAGLRRVLIERGGTNALVTLLMSATVGERHLRTLETLYPGVDGTLGVIWGSALRTEPSIFINKCTDETSRDERVLDAVMCAPRPLIVYTTRIRDSHRIVSMLRDRGVKRVAMVTGDSSESERRDAIEGWRGQGTTGESVETKYDVVVGTSAFGLGVDFAEVRTVIHACVPETLDRFYQEIGRAGRDGFPSLAVTYWTDADLRMARRMSRTTLISAEKGWERWKNMLSGANRATARTASIDLNSLPNYLPEGFGQSAQWNLRTLNLMARAGLIRLGQPTPPDFDAEVSREDRQAIMQRFYEEAWDRVDVTILDGATGDEGSWRERVAYAAAELRRMEDAGVSRLLRTFQSEDCLGSILAEHFSPRQDLRTSRTCRGCKWCRSTHQQMVDGFYARAADPNPDTNGLLGAGYLPVVRDSRSTMGVWWNGTTDRNANLGGFLTAVLRRCIPVFVGSLTTHELERMQKGAPSHPLMFDGSPDLLWSQDCPLVYVHSDNQASLPAGLLGRLEDRLPTIYCFPRSLRSAESPDFLHIDVASDHMSLLTTAGRL